MTTTQTYGNRQDQYGYLSPESQASIIAINHAEANMMDYARGMQVVTVTASGLTVTRAMIDAEIRATKVRPVAIPAARLPLVIGLNASVSMFA